MCTCTMYTNRKYTNEATAKHAMGDEILTFRNKDYESERKSAAFSHTFLALNGVLCMLTFKFAQVRVYQPIAYSTGETTIYDFGAISIEMCSHTKLYPYDRYSDILNEFYKNVCGIIAAGQTHPCPSHWPIFELFVDGRQQRTKEK